jgi:tetratricopeptide (TPR) repeat protein
MENSSNNNIEITAEQWFERGNDSLKSNPTEAVEYYNEAIRLEPNDVGPYCGKGIALKILGRYEEAILAYDNVIRLEPDYADSYFNKGNTLKILGRSEEAILAYDEAIRLEPNHSDCYLNKGNNLKILGRYEEAILAYDEAIRLDPENSNIHSCKGMALNGLGMNKEAILAYDEAIRLKPDSASAHFNRGITLNEIGRKDEAMMAYKNSSKFKPDRPSAYYKPNKVIALNEVDKKNKAILPHDNAIKLEPSRSSSLKLKPSIVKLKTLSYIAPQDLDHSIEDKSIQIATQVLFKAEDILSGKDNLTHYRSLEKIFIDNLALQIRTNYKESIKSALDSRVFEDTIINKLSKVMIDNGVFAKIKISVLCSQMHYFKINNEIATNEAKFASLIEQALSLEKSIKSSSLDIANKVLLDAEYILQDKYKLKHNDEVDRSFSNNLAEHLQTKCRKLIEHAMDDKDFEESMVNKLAKSFVTNKTFIVTKNCFGTTHNFHIASESIDDAILIGITNEIELSEFS